MQQQAKSIRIAISSPDHAPPTSSVFAGTVRTQANVAWSLLREWAFRWRSRRELRSLTQREITDFCPKLTDALREAEKPFWRP
jgi:uncharacterized protein YjiS (DUF1127 family)